MAETVARKFRRPIAIVRHPIYSMLLPVPIVCFLGLVITDLSYLDSDGNLTWLHFSSWLNAAGLLFAGVAAAVLLIEILRGAAGRGGWLQFVLIAIAWIVELINAFVHARDGWSAVAGLGLTLSVIGAVLMGIAGWLHRPALEDVR